MEQDPRWGRDCSRSCPPPVPFSKSQNSGTGRKLPAADRSEQMLSAHSRKLEVQHPAAHPSSRWGLPLALTHSPVARVGDGTGSAPQQMLRQEKTDQRTVTMFLLLSQLAPFRRLRRVHSLLSKFGQAAVPLWASTGCIW